MPPVLDPDNVWGGIGGVPGGGAYVPPIGGGQPPGGGGGGGWWEDITTNIPGGRRQIGTKPVAPTEIGGHWDIPDYEKLMKGYSGYIEGMGRVNTGRNTAGINRLQALKNAVAKFGGGFDRSQMRGYDDATWQAVQEASAAGAADPFSDLNVLNRGRARESQDLAAKLAGSGWLTSGARTGGEMRAQERLLGGQRAALDTLLGRLGGFEQDYAGQINALAAQEDAIRKSASEYVQGANPATWVKEWQQNPDEAIYEDYGPTSETRR